VSAYRQSDSDPLPYVQVDRAVKPRAALLAGALGVTTQHALGSLVEWWDLNGDPRELERIVEATPDGATPAVVVTREDAALRFRLASGKDVEPVTLVHLGLLEPVGDGFRVRGMSRYFAPVEARIRARQAAAAGGRKRAAQASRGANGRLLSAGDAAGAPAGESAGADQPTIQPGTSRQPADSQPTASPIGQRSAVSGQLQVKDSAPLFASPPARPPKAKPDKPTDPRHAPLVVELVEAYASARNGARYPFGPRDARAVSTLLAQAAPDVVARAWRRALAHQGFPTVATLSELSTHLAHFVADAAPGRGPVPAESVDWTQQQTGEVPL
jgi:hypothetical protein